RAFTARSRARTVFSPSRARRRRRRGGREPAQSSTEAASSSSLAAADPARSAAPPPRAPPVPGTRRRSGRTGGYTVPARGCGGIGRRARFRSVCPLGRGGSSPLIRTLTGRKLIAIGAAAAAAASLSGAGRAHETVPTTEVVVTLKAPPLTALGRSLTSARRAAYARTLAAAQRHALREIRSAVPSAH